jgi:hypothetical protein
MEDEDGERAEGAVAISAARPPGGRTRDAAVPRNGLRQALVEAGARPPAERSPRARGVERAARLAVGLGRDPTQASAEAGECRDLLRQLADRDLAPSRG